MCEREREIVSVQTAAGLRRRPRMRNGRKPHEPRRLNKSGERRRQNEEVKEKLWSRWTDVWTEGGAPASVSDGVDAVVSERTTDARGRRDFRRLGGWNERGRRRMEVGPCGGFYGSGGVLLW